MKCSRTNIQTENHHQYQSRVDRAALQQTLGGVHNEGCGCHNYKDLSASLFGTSANQEAKSIEARDFQ